MSNETVLTDEHISEVFLKFCDAENAEFSDVARAIEQAVLQSEQVQAWKKDAERYRWLRDQTWEGEICTVTKPGKHVRLGAYCPSHELLDMFVDDAAMEKQP